MQNARIALGIVMAFHVSTRIDDIYLDATFDTELAALARARVWAKVGEVVITHRSETFTLEQFARKVEGTIKI